MKGVTLSIRLLLLIVAGIIVVGIVTLITVQNLDLFASWGGERINGTLTR